MYVYNLKNTGGRPSIITIFFHINTSKLHGTVAILMVDSDSVVDKYLKEAVK